MKKQAGFLLVLALVLSGPGCAHQLKRAPDFLTQFSVIDALLAGNYDRSLTCGAMAISASAPSTRSTAK